ncbi:MAG: lysylphosphatidylglycerol synthase transmembrane domain-containing protein [Anaerolineae bacterium]
MKVKPLDVLKIAVSAALVAYLLWRVDTAAVAAALRTANVPLLLAALLIYFGALGFGLLKWQVLVAAQGERVRLADLAAFTFTGLFFGNFLPTSLGGDVVRGFDMARHLRRAEDAAVSVLMDRVIGLVALITVGALMAAVAVFGWGRGDLMTPAMVVWLACAAALAGLAAVLSRRLRRLMARLFEIGPLRRLAPIWERLSTALQSYRERPVALAKAYCLGVGMLLTSNVVQYLLSQAVGAGIPMKYIFLCNPLTAFAPLIVPSLGGLGVNQGAYDLLYATTAGVTTPVHALTVSLLMQLIIYITSLPGGVLWLLRRQSNRAREAALTRGETPASAVEAGTGLGDGQ